MPVKTKKVKGGGYSNSTPNGVKAKNTTKEKAEAQARLLNAIEHNPNFRPHHKKMARRILGSK